MTHNLKYLLLLPIVSVALVGCGALGGGKQKPISNQVQVETTGGDVVSVVVNSDDYVALTTDVAAERTREECFKANAAMPTDSTAQALREMRLATGGKVDCGAGRFDVAVVEAEQKTERTKTRWGTGERILGKAVIGGAIYGGLSVLRDIAISGNENAGNEVIVQDGSTLEGNVGEGNVYTRTESRDGIPLNPVDSEGISIGAGNEGSSFPVVDFTTCIAAGGSPVNSDGLVMVAPSDGTYLRCSDGAGGTIE